jgi:hypothetical protein
LVKGFAVEGLSDNSRTFVIIRERQQKFKDYCLLECGAMKSGIFVPIYLLILPPPSPEYPDTSETSVFTASRPTRLQFVLSPLTNIYIARKYACLIGVIFIVFITHNFLFLFYWQSVVTPFMGATVTFIPQSFISILHSFTHILLYFSIT